MLPEEGRDQMIPNSNQQRQDGQGVMVTPKRYPLDLTMRRSQWLLVGQLMGKSGMGGGQR